MVWWRRILWINQQRKAKQNITNLKNKINQINTIDLKNKINLKNKFFIATIASVGVVIIALSFGLGFGLSGSADDITSPGGTLPANGGGSKDPRIDYYSDPILEELRDKEDLLANGISWNGEKIEVTEENNKLYATIKQGTRLELSFPEFYDTKFGNTRHMGGVNYSQTIITPGDDSVTPVIEPKVEFFGEDYFYTFPFAGIGHVKIQNDGYIWGGYVYNFETEKMELHETLSEGDPLRFGKVFEDGKARIDLGIVAEYQSALNEYNSAANDNVKEQSATRIQNADDPNKRYLRGRNNEFRGYVYWYSDRVWMLTNDKATKVADILIHKETAPDSETQLTALPEGYVDEYNHPYTSSSRINTFPKNSLKCNTGHNFRFIELVNEDFLDICYGPYSYADFLSGNGYANGFFPTNLYYPLYNIKGGFIKHPLLDHFNATPDGKVVFPNHEPIQIDEKSNSFTLPFDLKLELTKDSLINLEKYAKYGDEKSDHVLLINIRKEWWNYFKNTAEFSEIKEQATSLGLTIRFRIDPFDDNRRRFVNDPEEKTRNADVFFLSNVNNEINYFKTNNKVAPLKYKLKTNLSNPDYFDNSWRDDATFKTNDGTDVYGFYPLNEDVQLIAYNTEFLPNGLDFSAHPSLYEHLTSTNQLPDSGNIKAQSELNERSQKETLLVPGEFSSPIWANNYYDALQSDQKGTNDQDVAWKKDNEENAYYTVFKDPNLKDEPKFQAWVDHYKNARPDFMSKQFKTKYTRFALFKLYVGALMIEPWWVDQQWRSGELKYAPNNDADAKRTFAEEKIKFQALPESARGTSTRWFAAMTAGISDKKQQLAEAFLAKLTDPERVEEFNHELLKLPARKDVKWNDVNDPILLNLVHAKENTKTVSGQWLPDWARESYRKTLNWINNTATYERVINEFTEVALKNDLVNALYAPITSSG